MAFSKAHHFERRDYYFSQIFRALGHPARINHLRRIARKKDCTVEQLLSNLPIHENTVSQHLKILRESSILDYREDYPTIHYFFNESMPTTKRIVIELLTMISRHKEFSEIEMMNNARERLDRLERE